MILKRAALFLALLLPLPALAGPMVPLAGFDNTALIGAWFEVASTPTILEQDCHGTTVSVAPRTQDSRLVLKMACPKGSVDGTVLEIDGLMVPTAPGIFQVRFVHLMELGNLDLIVVWQAPDGSAVALGSPAGAVGWVWSKVAKPDAATLEAAKAALAGVGYNPQFIADVDQGK